MALLIHTRHFFQIIQSVSNIWSNVANFPAKKLKAPKIRMRQFFFPGKFDIVNKLNNLFAVVLYHYYPLIGKSMKYTY